MDSRKKKEEKCIEFDVKLKKKICKKYFVKNWHFIQKAVNKKWLNIFKSGEFLKNGQET